MSQATLKQSFGALLAATTTAADTASAIFTGINTAVNMAQDSLADSAANHRLELKGEQHLFKRELALRLKKREVALTVDAVEFRNTSPLHAELYDKCSDEIDKLLGI